MKCICALDGGVLADATGDFRRFCGTTSVPIGKAAIFATTENNFTFPVRMSYTSNTEVQHRFGAEDGLKHTD